MKIVTYKYEDIQVLTNLINSLKISGFDQAMAVASIGNILDSGEIKERHEATRKSIPDTQEGEEENETD